MILRDDMRVLVLAPHPDDMEFGCGGVISKLSGMGATIELLVFSTCGQSLPAGFSSEDIIQEQLRSAMGLGLLQESVRFMDFPVRNFGQYRQEILEEMVALKKTRSVDLVFTPSSADIHQDHAVVCHESIRAFKETCLLGYELPWNNITSTHNFYFSLSKKEIEAKQQALQCFESQRQRSYGAREMLSLAEVRGMQVKQPYAEAFEVIRWVQHWS